MVTYPAGAFAAMPEPGTLPIHVGSCPSCGHGVATHGATGRTATCTHCGTPVVCKGVRGVYSDKTPCDDRCQYAAREHCECQCGGENHGAGYIVPVGERPEWVTKRDADRHAAKAARKAAALKSAQDDLTARFPALARLDNWDDDSEFCDDMREAFSRGRMTDRQAAAAARSVERAEAREARRQERDQVKAAAVTAGVSAPTGRVTMTGRVSAVVVKETHYTHAGESTLRMCVEHPDGWSAWMTCPDALQHLVTGEPRFTVWDQYGIVQRGLRGAQIEVTVTLAPGRDPLVATGTRPSKPRILATA